MRHATERPLRANRPIRPRQPYEVAFHATEKRCKRATRGARAGAVSASTDL